MGETPRVRTDVVDKVLLEAIAAGLKSNKKVIQTGKGARPKKAAQNLKVSDEIKWSQCDLMMNVHSFLFRYPIS